MKTTTHYHLSLLRPALILGVLLFASPLFGATYIWNNPLGGDFGTAANWNGTPAGVPGAADLAYWSGDTPVVSAPITSTMDRTVSIIYVTDTTFSLDFGGNNFSAVSPIIGVTGATSDVTFTNGSYAFTSVAQIGGNSILRVQGASTQLTSTGLDIGYYAGSSGSPFSTQLLIEQGANYSPNDNNVYIGGEVDYSQGLLRLTGSTTTATLGSGVRVYVGSNVAQTENSGTFRVDDGAKSTGGAGIYVGQGVGTVGTLVIEGAGSSVTSAEVNIGGNNSASGGTGNLLVHSGGSLTTGALRNWANGTITVGQGSTLTVDALYHGSTAAGDDAAVLKGSGSVIADNAGSAGNILLHGEVRAGDTDAGADIGTLTLGSTGQAANVRFYDTSATYFEFNNTTDFDRISILGSLTGDSDDLGQLVLTFNFVPDASDTFAIVTATSFSGTPQFSDVVWSGLATGGDISYSGNIISLSNIGAVPEPSAVILVVMGAMLLLASKAARRVRKA